MTSQFLKLYSRYKSPGILAAGIVSVIISAAGYPAYSWLVGSFLDDLAQGKDTITLYIPLFCALTVTATVTGLLVPLLFGIEGARVSSKLQINLLRTALAETVESIEKNGSGVYSSAIMGEVDTIAVAIKDALPNFILGSLIVLYQIGLTFYNSWAFGVLCLGVAVLTFFATFFPFQKVRIVVGKLFAVSVVLNRFIPECVAGIRTVKAYQWENEAIQFFSSEVAKLAKIKTLLYAIFAGNMASATFITNGISCLAVYVSVRMQAEGLTIGQITILFSSFLNASVFMRMAATKILDVVKAEKSAVHISSLCPIKLPKNFSHSHSPLSIQSENAVQLQDVSFSFDGRDHMVLKHLSMMVCGYTALVGFSGAGKSTLANILLGFVKGYTGSIEIFGNDLSSVESYSVLSVMGYVPQEPFLFAGTIEDNIRMGKADIALVDIEEAAKLAGIHDEISALPEGYKTIVNKNSLSGGQKQRVCIARALARKPKLLILDEPTSALDGLSESKISSSLIMIRNVGVAVLIITHQLHTIQNADMIYVLHDGAIVEQGSYQQLASSNGLFSSMVEAQKQNRVKFAVRERSTTL